MHGRRTFILATLGIASVLLLAANVVTVSPPKVPPFRIPTGNLGDEVTYGRYERAEPGADWEFRRFELFTVNEVTSKANETGTIRPVVEISWMPVEDEARPYVAFVDLETRDVVRRDVSMYTGLYTKYPRNVSDFGPRLEAAWYGSPDPTLLWTQNVSVGPDDDFTPGWKQRFFLAWGLATPGASMGAYRAWISDEGAIEGQAARLLRQEGSVAFNVSKGGPFARDWDHRVHFLSDRQPRVARVDFTRDTWVAASNPYPLRIHDHTVVNGSVAQDVLLVQVALKTGNGPVPWRPAVANPAFPEVELSSAGSGSPEEGTGSQLAYRLSQAQRDVETLEEYAAFQVWRQNHPGSQLVGMVYTHWGSRLHWALVYGTPEGEGYRVYAWHPRVPTAKDAANRPWEPITDGPTITPKFDPAVVRQSFVTIGHVERMWSAFANGESLPTSPRMIKWGFSVAYEEGPTGYYVPHPKIEDLPSLRRTPGNVSQFATITAMRIHLEGPSMGDGCFADYECIKIDARTGQVREASLAIYPYTSIYLDGIKYHEAKLAPGMQVQSITPAKLAPAPVTYGPISLLALLLLFYFYPLLKYTGTQAAGGFLGYARLRRSDIFSNQTRDALVQLIRNDPGIDASALGRRVDAGWSTVVYHLGVLEKNKIVSSLTDGRHRRFFPVDSIDWNRRPLLSALKNEKTKLIYETLLKEPGLIRAQLARRLGISGPGISWHIDRLKEVGLVGGDRDGRKMRFFANPNVSASQPPTPASGMEFS